MATIEDAIRRGVLEDFELPDWEARLPMRSLYVAAELFKCVQAMPELHDRSFARGGRLLVEHLEQMFCDFRCAKRPGAGDLRRLMPTKHGIWKMHPPGLRVHGWCPARHAFVAVAVLLEQDTKTNPRANDQMMKDVRNFIKRHKLDGTVLRGDHRDLFPPIA